MKEYGILELLMDEITIEILSALKTKEYYVRELIKAIRRNPNAVVRRLKILEKYELIKSRVEGKLHRRKMLSLTEKGKEVSNAIRKVYEIIKRR